MRRCPGNLPENLMKPAHTQACDTGQILDGYLAVKIADDIAADVLGIETVSVTGNGGAVDDALSHAMENTGGEVLMQRPVIR